MRRGAVIEEKKYFATIQSTYPSTASQPGQGLLPDNLLSGLSAKQSQPQCFQANPHTWLMPLSENNIN